LRRIIAAVPSPVKRNRRPSARERTAELLAQTARQLRDGGEMTVAAVAERAGVSRATAYRYFVSNDAVTVWATRPVSIQADAPEVPVPLEYSIGVGHLHCCQHDERSDGWLARCCSRSSTC
jgi:Helix-turn-helix domain of resolvase